MENEQAIHHESHKCDAQGPEDPMGKSGVHALVQHKETSKIDHLYAKTRTDLAKTLAAHKEHNVLAVFKGKQLKIQEKKSFHLG